MHKKIAFTLAEILITLGIIGVIAVLTIPPLMKSNQNHEYTSLFFKSYSSLSNAFNFIKNENGGTISGLYPTINDLINGLTLKLKTSKICYTSSAACDYPTNWKNLYGDDFPHANAGYVILADGALLTFYNFNSNCTGNRYSQGSCSEIYMDTNGYKLPNQLGRDIFVVFITNNGIIPNGAPGTVDENKSDSLYCDPKSTYTYNGYVCARRLLTDRQMNY